MPERVSYLFRYCFEVRVTRATRDRSIEGVVVLVSSARVEDLPDGRRRVTLACPRVSTTARLDFDRFDGVEVIVVSAVDGTTTLAEWPCHSPVVVRYEPCAFDEASVDAVHERVVLEGWRPGPRVEYVLDPWTGESAVVAVVRPGGVDLLDPPGHWPPDAIALVRRMAPVLREVTQGRDLPADLGPHFRWRN